MTSFIVPRADEGEETMSTPEMPPAMEAETVVEDTTPQNWVTLRRSGKAPYRFKGTLFASATSYYCGSRLWYEINIYNKLSGGYVVDVRVFKKSENDRDLFKISSFDSLDDIFEYLENYKPDEDVSIFFDASERTVSTSDMTLQAVSLRHAMDEAIRDYRALVGDLMYQLYQHNAA